MVDYHSPQQIKSDREAIAGGDTAPGVWLKKIRAAEKAEKTWRDNARRAIRIYEGEEKSQVSNLYHSNIETLVPSLYNATPIPDVRRRYNDEDPIGKEVSDLVERAVSYTVDQFSFDSVMVELTKHSVLPGRGVVRVRYEPKVDDSGIKDQKCYMEVVPWDRFVRGPARTWSRMPWIAFRHDLTEDELRRLGVTKERLTTLGFGTEVDDDEDDERDEENETGGPQKGIYLTVPVYEIWDKASRRIIFLTPEDKEHVLAVQQDELGLPEFYPCPEPLQQIKRASALTPVCPYDVYRALMDEFNHISGRITKLVGQLKVRGIIDKELEVDAAAIDALDDGQFAIANGVKAFQSAGGGALEQGIAFWPIEKIVVVLQQLYPQREALKQLIYEVTGISDILRGASDARETATAQQIKTQWGSLRLQRLQAEVARVARDVFRMMADIICRHYEWERIKQMTGLTFAPEMPEGVPPEQMGQAQMQAMQAAQKKEQAVEQLFRSDELRSFRIDIEADSTIRGDQQRNMEQMNLFLQVTAQYATAIGGLVQLAPAVLPAATEIFVSFARRFKLGKTAEDALEKLSDIANQAAEQPKPDPEAEKAQMEMQLAQAKAQSDQQKSQADMQLKTMDAQLKQLDLQMKQLELEIKQAEAQRSGGEVQVKQAGLDLDFGHDTRMKNLEYEHAHRMKSLDVEAAETKQHIATETARVGLQAKQEADALAIRHQRMSSDADIDGKLRKSAADRAKQVADKSNGKDGPKKVKIDRGPDGTITGAVIG